jgi:HEAT repeat protein
MRAFGKFRPKPAWLMHREAIDAFEVLGPDARCCVSALTNILVEKNISPSSQAAIASALGAIGPSANAAIPALLREVKVTNSNARLDAIVALGAIHSGPEDVVPILIDCLDDPSPSVRAIAARSLGMFGTNAGSALPRLSRLNNEGRFQRIIDLAIKQITGMASRD